MTFKKTANRNYSMSTRAVYLWAFLLWVAFAAVDVWWILYDRQPQGCDQAGHLIRAAAFAHSLHPFSLNDLLKSWNTEVGQGGEYTYPPLYHLVTGVFIWVLGRPPIAAVATNEIALWFLLVSVIQLGRRAFTLSVGVGSAVLVALYATLAQFRHEAFVDFALVGITSWSAWQLVKTEAFSRRRASIGVGISIGLALLVKQAVVIFLAPPALYVLFQHRGDQIRNRWVNVLCAAGSGLLVASTWYGLHWRAVMANLALNQRVAPIEGDPMPWTLIGAIYYPWVMSCIQIGFPLFVVAIASAMVWLFRKRQQTATTNEKRLCRGVIVTWIVGSLPVLTFLLLNKDMRYSLPVLPAVALLTCSLLTWISRRPIRIAGWLLLMLSAFPYYTFVMFAWPPIRQEIGFYTGQTHWLVWSDNNYFGMGPKKEDWHIPEMLTRMRLESPQSTLLKPIHIAILPFLLRFNPNSVTLEAIERGIPAQVTAIGNDTPALTPEDLRPFDFLLVKTGDLGLPFATERAQEIQNLVSLHPDNFVPLATYALPDHSTGTLLRVVREKE